MSLTKFLDPKNDFAFKRIFGSLKNKDILIHFINDMLCFVGDKKITEVQFLKPSQDPDILSKKQSILDVLCTDPIGRQYIVEMQVAKTAGFEQRAQYYAAKAYANQLNQGDGYHQLKEIIFVAITDFIMFPDKKNHKSDHVILDKITYDHDLKDFSFTFLELPKFNKSIDQLSNMIEKWTYFFKHAEETTQDDLKKIIGDDQIIERAYEALNRFSLSQNELFTYDAEEKRIRDEQAALDYALSEAEAKGEIKGDNLATHRIAKTMLQKGMSAEAVSEMTGLSIAEIKKL